MIQILVTIVFVVALAIDFVPKWKQRKQLKRECWFYAISMAASYAILILVSYGKELPSAFAPADKLVEWLFHK